MSVDLVNRELKKIVNGDSLNELSELFLLVDQACFGKEQEFSKDEKSELRDLNLKIKFYQKIFRKNCEDHPSKARHNNFWFADLVPRFVKILRDFLLTHQWSQALKWLQAISKETRKESNVPVWKAGLECLIQNDCQQLIQSFVKQVFYLPSITCVEVLLDYLLHLLTLGDLMTAKELILDVKKADKKSQNILCNEHRKEANLLFYAYQGMVLFLEWKIAVSEVEHFHECSDGDLLSQTMSVEQISKNPLTIANLAVENLMTVKDQPGVWDIFILKVIAIHEHYDKVEEARAVLDSYRSNNPDNPNAHRILYEFEARHGGMSDLAISCLKDVVALDPCNPLAVSLFNALDQADPDTVSILFDFLDYDHCKENRLVWKLLSTHLTFIAEGNDAALKGAVLRCWHTRRDWWPSFVLQSSHLQHHVTSEGDHSSASSLKSYKKIARKILCKLEGT